MTTFDPHEPQPNEAADADLIRNQLNAVHEEAIAAETDPIVGAINGLVKADGAGTIAAAVPDTDYLTPTGNGAGLTGVLTTLAGHNVSELTNDAGYVSSQTLGVDLAGPVTLYAHAPAGSVGDDYLTVFKNNGPDGDRVLIHGGAVAMGLEITGRAAGGGAKLVLGEPGDHLPAGVTLAVAPNDYEGDLTLVAGSVAGKIILQATAGVVDGTGTAYLLATGDGTGLTGVLHDATAFATAAQGGKADTALQPVTSADGTYPVANDGTTSGQLAGLTITNGLITGVTLVP